MMQQNDTVEEIFQILRESAERPYFGGAVSQLEHALQAAYYAAHAQSDDDLITTDKRGRAEGIGVIDHDEAGAEYLRSRGFSYGVTALVRGT